MTLSDFSKDEIGLDSEIKGYNLINYFLYWIFIFFLPILVVNIFVSISVDEMRKLIDDSQNQSLGLKTECFKIIGHFNWVRRKAVFENNI